YGYTLPAAIGHNGSDHRWPGFITSSAKDLAIAQELATDWGGSTFALIDHAVRKDRRGEGTGRKLIERLLANRHDHGKRVTMAVEPTAEEAHSFYTRLGWERVGRKRTSTGFDVYVQSLDPVLHQVVVRPDHTAQLSLGIYDRDMPQPNFVL